MVEGEGFPPMLFTSCRASPGRRNILRSSSPSSFSIVRQSHLVVSLPNHGRRGIRTPGPPMADIAFRERPIRPLWHPSKNYLYLILSIKLLSRKFLRSRPLPVLRNLYSLTASLFSINAS